ncbi:M48 family metallopeptidase [Pelosinus sp. sgz500959]|uniref:M48 family metallopeptidase n=1 Tax=Pelosinus sp. sgz500959 TaxID=3242472 RepID=UPI00366EBDFD
MPNFTIMNMITLANHPLTYHIIYQKNRKSLQLKIISSRELEIIAPNKFPKTAIEKILYEKSNWIIKKILHLENLKANPTNKLIAHGATVLYLGQIHTLHFTETQNIHPIIHLYDHQIIINISSENASVAEALLKQWYITNARTLLIAKTALWATKINVQPQRLTIKEQKTRWGSCSSKSNINYNWRIIMAPPEVIDYLVIHELCHLRVLNHSSLFWQEVGKFSPNFKEHRQWLKNNGALLMNFLQNA